MPHGDTFVFYIIILLHGDPLGRDGDKGNTPLLENSAPSPAFYGVTSSSLKYFYFEPRCVLDLFFWKVKNRRSLFKHFIEFCSRGLCAALMLDWYVPSRTPKSLFSDAYGGSFQYYLPRVLQTLALRVLVVFQTNLESIWCTLYTPYEHHWNTTTET